MKMLNELIPTSICNEAIVIKTEVNKVQKVKKTNPKLNKKLKDNSLQCNNNNLKDPPKGGLKDPPTTTTRKVPPKIVVNTNTHKIKEIKMKKRQQKPRMNINHLLPFPTKNKRNDLQGKHPYKYTPDRGDFNDLLGNQSFYKIQHWFTLCQ